MRRVIYSGQLRLLGLDHRRTLIEAYNYATCLAALNRFKELKALMLKTIPVARRTLGESDDLMIAMRSIYAEALYKDDAATVGDLREAVTTFEDLARTARRVFGIAHPDVMGIERNLRRSRAALSAREETPTLGTA